MGCNHHLGQLSLASLLGSLNRVPDSAGVKAGSHLCQVAGKTLRDPIRHVISRSSVLISIANCYICAYFFDLIFHDDSGDSVLVISYYLHL